VTFPEETGRKCRRMYGRGPRYVPPQFGVEDEPEEGPRHSKAPGSGPAGSASRKSGDCARS